MKKNYGYAIPVLIFIIGIYFFVNHMIHFQGIDSGFQELKINSSQEVKLVKSQYQVYFESKKMHLYNLDSLKIKVQLENDLDTIALFLPEDSLTMNSNYTINRKKGILIGNLNCLNKGIYQGIVSSKNQFEKSAQVVITQPFIGRIFQQIIQIIGIAFGTVILTFLSSILIYFFQKKKKKTIKINP